LNSTEFSTVTLTCTGATAPEIPQLIFDKLSNVNIKTFKLIMSSMSATVMVASADRKRTIENLHALI